MEMPNDISILKKVWWFVKFKIRGPPNFHGPLEKWEDFKFPQRLLIASILSLMVLFYVYLGSFIIIFYGVYVVDAAYNRLVEFEIAGLNKVRGFAQNHGLANNGLFQDFWGMVVAVLTGVTININNNLLNTLKYQLVATGASAATLSFLLMFLLWAWNFRIYRNNIMLMRQGKYEVRKSNYSLRGASSYIGTQMSHTAFGFLFLFVVAWIVIFCLTNDLIRTTIWEGIVETRLLRILATASFIVSIVLFLFKFFVVGKFLTSGFIMYHRRWFSLFDYANMFLSVLGGLFSVFVRWLIALGVGLLTFLRLDIPSIGFNSLESFDPGYSAFMSMILCDAEYNNPVFNVFAHLLIKGHNQRKARREEARAKQSLENLFNSVNNYNNSDIDFIDSDADIDEGEEARLILSKDKIGRQRRESKEGGGGGGSGGEGETEHVDESGIEGQIKEDLRRARIRNRWRLYVLLAMNPKLVKYRKNNMSSSQKMNYWRRFARMKLVEAEEEEEREKEERDDGRKVTEKAIEMRKHEDDDHLKDGQETGLGNLVASFDEAYFGDRKGKSHDDAKDDRHHEDL
jgi:hypothetical protein